MRSADTFALTFYSLDIVDLFHPVIAPVCIVRGWDGYNVQMQVYKYESGKYMPCSVRFDTSLKGSLGCTGAAALGFYLQKELFNHDASHLTIINIVDQWKYFQLEELNLPVADEYLIEFCRATGGKIYINSQESDCENYVACMKQSGERCALDKAKCVAKHRSFEVARLHVHLEADPDTRVEESKSPLP